MSKVRLIDADALKNRIIDIFDEEVKHDKKWAMGLKYSLKIIDKAPTVDAETCINYKLCEVRKQCELLKAIEDCED